MNYGHFDPVAREYVITRPDTPRPWSNYLGSRRYGGIVTQHAGGYSFTRSPAEGRILRHRYNSVPADLPGRQFYLRDRASGDFWSAAWQPVGKPLADYATTTRFGTGYAVITSTYAAIRAEATYFIPLDTEFEYWRLRVTNTGTTPRQLSVFSFCEFTSEWNLLNDLLNLQYTQYIGRAHFSDGFIAASSCGSLPEDLANFANRDQARRWWMTQRGGRLSGHDCDRECFLGRYGGFDRPAAVVAGACTDSSGYSDNTCGALQSEISLAPGETVEVIVLLGIGDARTVGRRVARRYGTPAACEREFARLRAHWHARLDTCQVETPDTDFNHMANVWGAYNALIAFEWARSCSLVYTGDQRDGFGFRDAVQDTLGVVAMTPDLVRERLLLMLSGQESHGGARPEVRPWAHEPGKMKPTPAAELRSDDCLWFFNAVPAYVAESGDMDFYDCVVPFADRGRATVLGHLRRALKFNLARTGSHGLPCGLLADWNDCLKLGYRGESVFVAFQVRLGLRTYAEIATRLGRDAEAKWARRTLAQLDRKIARVCWDGGWFIWAIAEDGTVFGSRRGREGRIYLNTQCWAVLSGAATAEQTRLALDSVRRQLATPYGVELCHPPFRRTSVKVMRAVLFNPGNKENGGIFSHTQSWIVLAEIARGAGDAAYDYFRSFLPSAQNDRADQREIEPYVHCQSTHGRDSEKHGRSRVPWLSGTASWAHYTALQHILGVRPEIDGLRIDPCIPRVWSGFSVSRLFRGKRVTIEVRNPRRVCRGVVALTLDGRLLPGNLAPAADLRDGSHLVATLG